MTADRRTYDADFWTRLTELSQLKQGWLDGEGTPPALDILETAGRLVTALPNNIRKVYAYPTVEGGVLLEWDDLQARHSVEIHFDRRLSLLSIDRAETGTEAKG